MCFGLHWSIFIKDRVFLVRSCSVFAGIPERIRCLRSLLRYSSGFTSGEYGGKKYSDFVFISLEKATSSGGGQSSTALPVEHI